MAHSEQSMKVSYTVLPDDFMRAGEASGALKKLLKELGFPSDTVRRCAIATYEGEMNMVIHAQGGVVEAIITPDTIELELRDTGPGISDIELAMTEGYSTASDAVRDIGFGAGMGLPNIQKYSDRMSLTSEVGVGTTLRMTIRSG
jgi:serine/threonine-protein kinase RsbT